MKFSAKTLAIANFEPVVESIPYISGMKKHLLLSLCLMLTLCSFGQSYSGPESVEFDYANRRWLIGNTVTHQILARDSTGVLSILVSNTVNGPYGIEIVGDTVFCCSAGAIKGYLLSNGSLVFNVNLGGTFLNGLTHDASGNLITTDFSARRIYKLNISSQTYTTIATNTVSTPNGIVFDEANNRCVFVNWGSNAAIKAIDLSTNAVSTLLSTALSNCDGITRDGAGRYYISAWGTQSVLRYDSSFSAPPTTVAGSLSSPADIFYNVVDDTLGIPNSGNNTVRFVGFASTVGLNDPASQNAIMAYPNPVRQGETVYLSAENTTIDRFTIYNSEGKLITRSTGNTFNTAGLPKGIYLIRADEVNSAIRRIVVE